MNTFSIESGKYILKKSSLFSRSFCWDEIEFELIITKKSICQCHSVLSPLDYFLLFIHISLTTESIGFLVFLSAALYRSRNDFSLFIFYFSLNEIYFILCFCKFPKYLILDTIFITNKFLDLPSFCYNWVYFSKQQNQKWWYYILSQSFPPNTQMI